MNISKNHARFLLVSLIITAGLIFLIAVPMTLTSATAAARSASATHGRFITVTATATFTPTITVTPTITMTPTSTVTPTATPTSTAVFSNDASIYLPIAIRPMPTNTPTPTPTATTPPSTTCLPDPPLGPSDAAVDEELANRIDQERANNGLSPYGRDERLIQAARRHAYDMAANNLTWHTGSDGTSYAERIQQACYDAQWVSEIIAYGFPSVDAAMAWWLDSDTHRNTILNTNLEEMGMAYVRDEDSASTHYWVVTFAKPAVSFDRITPLSLYTCAAGRMEADRGISIQWVQDRPCPTS